MKFFVGVTDYDLYITLKNSGCNEVNFWRPSDYNSFKAVGANDLFLFKLHSPHNFIVGGGYFVTSTILPSFLAWDVFGIKNGTQSLKELNRKILKYKEHKTTDGTINIGCIILAKPFFFEEADWIQAPEDWSLSIVQGKTYDTDTMIGRHLYQQVQERIKK